MLIIVLFIVLIGDFQFYRSIVEDIFGKFSKSSDAYVSSYARISSIGINLYLWMQKPIAGNGVTDKAALFSDTAMRIYGIANETDTNTLLAQFSMFGIVAGGIWLYAVFNMARKAANSNLEFCVLILLFCIILMTEFFIYSPIINLFIWYGLQRKITEKKTMVYFKHFKEST